MATPAQMVPEKGRDGRMKKLLFNLKWRWYSAISNGFKAVEYREIKPHWTSRIRNALGGQLPKNGGNAIFPTHLLAVFRLGYGRPSNFNSSSPDIVRRVMYIDIGPCPYAGWNGDYYRIHFEREDYRNEA